MKTRITLALLVASLAACSDDSTSPDDASTGQDTTVADAPHDTSPKDSAVDAGLDSPAADASDEPDATDDAADASISDASDASDAASDAPVDAPADVVVIIDAGKGCKGIFCIVGDTCCNNLSSVNYGKCEPTSCGSCCL